MNTSRQFSIRYKLWLQVVLIAVGIIGVTAVSMMQLQTNLMQEKEAKTAALVETAHSLLEGYYQKVVDGSLTLEAAQRGAADALRVLRYENGNYFWINDMHPRMVMHPVKPELDGEDLSGFEDPSGKRLFQAFVDKVAADGEGMVPYLWPKPGAEEPVAKISYVKGFEPWGWVIGSGIYVDDVTVLFWRSAVVLGAICLIILGILITTAWLLSRSIVRPLGRANEIARGIADGDLDQQVDIQSNDEIGQLGHSMSVMIKNLKRDIDETRKRADEASRVRMALDNVSSSVMMADNERKIIYLNNSARALFKDVEDDIRQELPDFRNEALLGGSIDGFHKRSERQAKLLASLDKRFESELKIGGRTMRIVANPVTSDTGERLGTAVEWSDRTVEVAVEEEVGMIVAAAQQGDLSQRIELSSKSGFFEKLGLGINTLIDQVEAIFNEFSDVLSAMAQGDLTRSIERDYQGSFDILKGNVNNTLSNLRSTLAPLRDAMDEMRAAANDISNGNNNLNARTEQQASTLQETASSMSELTSTVRNNADNAQQANLLARDARSTAELGGEVVNRAVQAMNSINSASAKIAEIVGVIDEIAFQTNLLALNASVEAARSGEHGRGFAVVATEVRNLAGRSADAAREVKGLVRDSGEKVELGTKLVNESGARLQEIVEAVKKAEGIVAEIAAASVQQSAGIEQVNQAVTSMDAITQQNAHLAEQTSSASVSMSDKAAELNALVGKFVV